MKWIIGCGILIWLTGCASKPTYLPLIFNPVVSLPDDLRYCDSRNRTPNIPPIVRTPKMLADFATQLELSREALIKERNDCNWKRAQVVRLFDELKEQKK